MQIEQLILETRSRYRSQPLENQTMGLLNENLGLALGFLNVFLGLNGMEKSFFIKALKREQQGSIASLRVLYERKR